jgi:putative phosphoesterase
MKFGIMSDTHKDKDGATKHIVAEFKRRGVEAIVHCGDIEPEHVNREYYDDFPMTCALTDEQVDCYKDNENGCPMPRLSGWKFTYPGKRIVELDGRNVYAGHKRSFDFLLKSEHELREMLNRIRNEYNNVRWMFSGHTHHQAMMGNLITFINPGAVELAVGVAGGYEFAILDTETEEIIFSRIQNPPPIKKLLNVGVISDSLDVSGMNPEFWKKLAQRFREEEVTDIIHCGNIYVSDIGLEELSGFNVYYNLRDDQTNSSDGFENWSLVDKDNPIVEIDGYKFCVQLSMGPELVNESEFQMNDTSMKILGKFPEAKFLLCGSTRTPLFEEGEGIVFLNPGDVISNRRFAIIKLPRFEITFGRIHPEPLPALDLNSL